MVTCYVEENIALNTHITQTHVFAMDRKDGQNTIGICDNIDLELLAGNYLFMEEDSRSWVELGAWELQKLLIVLAVRKDSI